MRFCFVFSTAYSIYQTEVFILSPYQRRKCTVFMVGVFSNETMKSNGWAERFHTAELVNNFWDESAIPARNCMWKMYREQHRCLCVHMKPIYHLGMEIKRDQSVIKSFEIGYESSEENIFEMLKANEVQIREQVTRLNNRKSQEWFGGFC